jgi:hypothetical protein
MFKTAWANDKKPYASVILDMAYVNSHAGATKDNCPGTLTQRSCEIRPAVVQYPVTVMVPSEEELRGENIVTHIQFIKKETWPFNAPLNNIEQIDGLEVMEYVDLVEGLNEAPTVGALTYIMNDLYFSAAALYFDQGWDINTFGGSASRMFYTDTDVSDKERCWYDIDRKTKDEYTIEILRKINTLSFITGLYLNGAPTTDKDTRAAAGMASQEFEVQVTGIVKEYLTNFSYVVGALAATFITRTQSHAWPSQYISSLWRSDYRACKMKAYHGDFDQLLMDVGDRRVQYGQLRDAPPGQMGLREPDQVVVPAKRERWRVSGRREKRRMGIGAVVGGVLAAVLMGNA